MGYMYEDFSPTLYLWFYEFSDPWSSSRHFCLVERNLIVVQQCSQLYRQEYPHKPREANAL